MGLKSGSAIHEGNHAQNGTDGVSKGASAEKPKLLLSKALCTQKSLTKAFS